MDKLAALFEMILRTLVRIMKQVTLREWFQLKGRPGPEEPQSG